MRYRPLTISTAYGLRRFAEPPLIHLALTEDESSLLVDALRREADVADADGQFELSEKLSRRATAIFEAGRLSATPHRHVRHLDASQTS